MIRRCLSLSLILCLTQICYGQTLRSAVNKTQALREVKVTTVVGWKEVISDEGRFRILFPGDPMVSDEVASMTGFKFAGPEVNWFAYYSDFGQFSTDGAQLRNAYRQSVEAIARKGSKVLRQGDAYLNGTLGTEFVLEGRGTISYMRAFLVFGRMWTLAVDSKRVTNGDSTTPKDVQQFFDSFTFWE